MAETPPPIEAGPVLDAWIAEHVMGWTRDEEWGEPGFILWNDGDGDERATCEGSHQLRFSPSTDMNDAMRVGDKIKLMSLHWHNDRDRLFVRFWMEEPRRKMVEGPEARTPALAICAAAVAWWEDKQ